MGPAIPVIAAVAGVVSAVGSIKQAKEAKKQRQAQEEQGRQVEASNTAEAARERRSLIRRARTERARAEAAGIQAGTSGSSAILGVQQGIAGDVSDSVSKTSGALLNISNQSAQNQIISASRQRQQTFAAVGNFAQSVAGAASDVDKAFNS